MGRVADVLARWQVCSKQLVRCRSVLARRVVRRLGGMRWRVVVGGRISEVIKLRLLEVHAGGSDR